MVCKICAIANTKIISEIENYLAINQGDLFDKDKKELIEAFPEFADQINKIDDQATTLHFNFHQRITRAPKQKKVPVENQNEAEPNCSIFETKPLGSLADEIAKDEAEVLYELLNSQAATFTALNNKISQAIAEGGEDLNSMIVHPTTIEFYNNVAASMRATVKEIRELNFSLNGTKDTALDGLKALVAALHGPVRNNQSSDEPVNDLTTKEFDD